MCCGRDCRHRLGYPSDLADQEWSLVCPMIPPAKHGGRPRDVDVREILNGILYVLSTGCQWRYIPKDLPPRSTLHGYFQRWDDEGTWQRIHYELFEKCREQEDRQASPTACVIDSQSVKSAEKGGAHIDPKGYDAGKKISGKKRHILVDTQGLLMHAIVHAADIQERDGGVLLLATMFGLYPFLEKLFADGGYQGPQFRESPSEKSHLELLSFLSISLIEVSLMNAKAVRFRFSKSLANLRQRLSQAKVRSTTHPRGSSSKPWAVSDRLTISTDSRGNAFANASRNFGPW